MRDGTWLRHIGAAALDLLYPRRCPLCERILLAEEGNVCPDCRKRLPYAREPLCKRCGKPLDSWEREYCAECGERDRSFVCGRAAFIYEKEMRRSIHRMKFQNRREYLDFYAEEMVKAGKASIGRWQPRVLIPVPMHRKKARARGFDQSRLLAEKISRLTGIPVDSRNVARVRATRPQKDLDARERRENLRGAFRVREGAQIPEPVLLIDDIYTTGTTLEAVSEALREHGIREIYFLTLSIGKGK